VPDDPVPIGFPERFVRGPGDRASLLVLSTLRGISPRQLHRLAWREGTATRCLEAIEAGRTGSEADARVAATADPASIAERVARSDARFVCVTDAEFPRDLLDLDDPPIGLFVRGEALTRLTDAVAVVGARNCSALGNEVAHDIGAGLARAGVCVVSGAARGIDAAAHRGALSVGGPTVAVLGSGIDVAYPKGSRDLIRRAAENGAVVSEYGPGVEAEPFRFPARNRLIAALGSALVVVEGAAGSGSMISVDHALALGRDVFAVPGPVTSPLSEVPLGLIRDGATMIRGADDLLADLGYEGRARDEVPAGLDDEVQRVYASLSGPCLPDVVARQAGLSIPRAVTALIGLELRGLVRSVGGRYERTLKSAGRSDTPA
jgi:DNA processing protein